MKTSQQIEDEGGPAFSYTYYGTTDDGDLWPGMTLRDWFAGQALSGFIAGSDMKLESFAAQAAVRATTQAIARSAYTVADAMLTTRSNR